MIIKLDDWQYTPYNPISRETAEETYEQVLQQKKLIDALEKTMVAELTIKTISDIIETHYDLGKVVEVFKMYGGQINLSYGFVAEKDGVQTQYFLRKYNRFADENRINFEHDFLTFLKTNGLDIIPAVIKTKEGSTFIQNQELDKAYFYAVYEFLEGKDRYRWFEDTTPPDVCYKIGVAVAKFHNLSSKYDTSRYAVEEPGVYYMMDEFKTRFTEFSKLPFNSIYHQTFCSNLDEVMAAMDNILTSIDPKTIESLPKVTVNGDLHQGNMKYDEDGNVVGLFDFDWIKTDTRLFEVAGLLLYLVTSWQAANDGEIYLEKLSATMEGYQRTLRECDNLAPLNATEAKLLPYFLQMCCIYNIVNWSAQDHYQVFDTINVFEYDYYLKHGLRVRRNAESLAGEIETIVLHS